MALVWLFEANRVLLRPVVFRRFWKAFCEICVWCWCVEMKFIACRVFILLSFWKAFSLCFLLEFCLHVRFSLCFWMGIWTEYSVWTNIIYYMEIHCDGLHKILSLGVVYTYTSVLVASFHWQWIHWLEFQSFSSRRLFHSNFKSHSFSICINSWLYYYYGDCIWYVYEL